MESASTPVTAKHVQAAAFLWRSLIIIGLAWAAEYALLELIGEANLALKVATILCAIAALFILEIEQWFAGGHRFYFRAGIIIVSILYLCFVGYAIKYAYDRYSAHQYLEESYTQGAEIRQAPFKGDVNVQDWTKKLQAWRDETSSYLKDNVGGMAYDKFLITGKGTVQYSKDEALNYGLNQASDLLANLESIIVSGRR